MQVAGLILAGLMQEFLQLLQTKASRSLSTQLHAYWTVRLSHPTRAFLEGLILAEIKKSNYSEDKIQTDFNWKICG